MDLDEKRYSLRHEFVKRIFNDLFYAVGNSHGKVTKVADLLEIPRQNASHYLYGRINSFPESLIKNIQNILNISNWELKQNTVYIQSGKDIRDSILSKGREIRKNQLKEWKLDIPKIEELFDDNYILIKKWFDKYIKLINFGSREFIQITENKDKIKLVYTNYSKSQKKIFVNYLPSKIKIDEDFQYFFGLWCGDRIGRGRFGVVNKNKDINLFVVDYLKKLHQIPNLIVYYSSLIKKPEFDYKVDGFYEIKKSKYKGYAIQVGIKNRIMYSFFDYLYKNLMIVISLLPNKNIFFAGLFDAEGNVFLEDSCFRWSCLDEEKVKIYIKHLKELNLFDRYDGCNLISYNKEIFTKEILPYLKHSAKINKSNLVCYKTGKLENRFLEILNLIKNN